MANAAGPSSNVGAASPADGSVKMDARQLRKEYRNIEEEAKQKNEALMSATGGHLQSMIARANELQNHVEKPREGAIDSSFFFFLSEKSFVATERLLVQANQGRTVNEFIMALRRKYVLTDNPQEDVITIPEAFQWETAGCRAWEIVKKRKVAQRQVRHRPTGEAARPEELHEIQENEKQETDRNMEDMWMTLSSQSSCPVAELVCNHDSFAQTVENMFTLSFLVRDQKAYLFTDTDKGMMVAGVSKNKPAPQQGNEQQLQFVFSFTMEDWGVMKRVVREQDCLTRKRTDHHDGVTNGRGGAGPSAAGPSARRRE